jgi:hypothetical protein
MVLVLRSVVFCWPKDRQWPLLYTSLTDWLLYPVLDSVYSAVRTDSLHKVTYFSSSKGFKYAGCVSVSVYLLIQETTPFEIIAQPQSTRESSAILVHTISFNTQTSTFRPHKVLCVFSANRSRNFELIHKQCQLTVFCFRKDGVCLLRGTSWIFVCNSGQS